MATLQHLTVVHVVTTYAHLHISVHMRTLTAYSRHTHSSLLPVEANMIYQLHNILQGMGRAEQSLLTTSSALTFASRRAGRALQLCPAPPHATLPGRQTGEGACGTAFK